MLINSDLRWSGVSYVINGVNVTYIRNNVQSTEKGLKLLLTQTEYDKLPEFKKVLYSELKSN
jgi:hypothetical protein